MTRSLSTLQKGHFIAEVTENAWHTTDHDTIELVSDELKLLYYNLRFAG